VIDRIMTYGKEHLVNDEKYIGLDPRTDNPRLQAFIKQPSWSR